MGRLERIEVENFKSYQGKQIIGPFDDFTCIIGPNGAGKSNMMDAISFVLGVQSKHLRSSHLKELIFRKDINSISARKARVSLIYTLSLTEAEDCGITSYTIPSSLSSSSSESHQETELLEIIFTRSISNAGVSSYRLSNKDVTYEIYEQTLQSIGVLVKARNFLVFQGDVEAVASKAPHDLTKLFEQISGSDTFCNEYEELLRRKDEAEENTIFSMQKKKMYVSQCKEVKVQKDEAEYYQQKQEELNTCRTDLVLFQIWCVKKEMEEKQVTALKLNDEIQVIQSNEHQVEEELDTIKKNITKAMKTVTMIEKESAMKRKQLDTLTPKVTETQAMLKGVQKRLNDFEKNKHKVQKDIDLQQESIVGLQSDIEALSMVESELKEELEEVDTSSASGSSSKRRGSGGLAFLDAAGMTEYTRLREIVSNRTAAERAEELTIDLNLESKEQLAARLQSQDEAFQKESESAMKLIIECRERRQKLRDTLAKCNADKTQLSSTKNELLQKIQRAAASETTITQELETVSQKLQEIGNSRRRNKQEERMAEAVASMQRIYKGVHGKLIDLCKPVQRKYAQAVTVAAGKHMDAIVVDSKAVANDCIRYLKDQRIGTCLFLPLDNLAVKPIPERLRTFGNRYRPCIDLIECDSIHKSAVSYAVGATLVCETLEDAQELCFQRNERVKAVTLRGHSISKSGAMTGGAAPRDGHDRWEQKEVDRLRDRKAELEQQLQELKRSVPTRQQMIDVETNTRSLQSKIQFTEADLRVTEEKLSYLNQQQTLREQTASSKRTEMEALHKEIKLIERRRAEVHNAIRDVENEVFADFSASMGIANIREYEETTVKKHQSLLSKLNSVTKQKSALEAQLQYENKRDFQGVLQRLTEQSEAATQERITLVDKEQELIQKEIDIRSAIRSTADKLTAAKNEKDSIAKLLVEVQQRRTEVVKDKDIVSKKLAGEEMQIERSRAQLHDILQKAQVEEVALPTVPVRKRSSASATDARNRSQDRRRRNSKATRESSDGSDTMRLDSESSDDTKQEDESDEDEDGDELLWMGNQSQSGSTIRGRSGVVNLDDNEESSGRSRDTGSSSDKVSASTHFSQADNPTVLRDSQEAAKVDLSQMRKKFRNISRQRIVEIEQSHQLKITEITAELEKIQPNMHAAERYDGVMDKLRECNDDLENTKTTARDLAQRFDEIRKQRQDLFRACFDHVAQSLGTIYKDLTRSSKHPLGGNAYLTLDNSEEPYLGGIRFTAMPPMKRFRDMDQLSGGEKTMAALALLFSIHSYRQAPFFVLDEVDAALDNVNVKKICNYIQQRSRDFQCIVISLKDMFFEHADSLVGVCKDVESLSSQVLTMQLSQYTSGNEYDKDNDEQDNDTQQSPSVSGSIRDHSDSRSSSSSLISKGQRQSSLGKRRGDRGASPSSTSPADAAVVAVKGKSTGRRILREAIIEEDEGVEEEGEEIHR